MRALFLRHGESIHNAHSGPQPLGEAEGDRLTELGRHQAEAAGKALGEAGVTSLRSSHMARARETAEAIGAAIGREPETLDYAGELLLAEPFENEVGRVRRLKVALEAGSWGDGRLIVTNGRFISHFYLDSDLRDAYTTPSGQGDW